MVHGGASLEAAARMEVGDDLRGAAMLVGSGCVVDGETAGCDVVIARGWC